jgi:hypothetical protein
MGIWGMAQAFGMGVSSFASGTLKTVLIESGFLSPSIGYTTIFGLEVVLMGGGCGRVAQCRHSTVP